MKPEIMPERIQKLMEERGLSVMELASRAGIHVSQPYKLLSGERPRSAATTIASIATALGTTTDYLLGLSDDPHPPENNAPLTDLEWRILQLFRLLPPWLQDVAIRQLDLWLDHRNGWEGEHSANEDAME